jgi:hypothetical protein
MEAIRSSETSVQTGPTRCYIPEDDILLSQILHFRYRKPSCPSCNVIGWCNIWVSCGISALKIAASVVFHEKRSKYFNVCEINSVTFHHSIDSWKNYSSILWVIIQRHITKNFIDTLNEVFGERVINTGLWPPRSPDLSRCDINLWRTWKRNIFWHVETLLEKDCETSTHTTAIDT